MGTDYVDLFLLHSQLVENDHESQKPDSSFVATGNLTTLKGFYDAVVPAMETLKKEGKILNWGIGPGQEEAVCDVINSTTPPDAIQCGVNVLNSLGAIVYASIKTNPKLVLDESKKKDITILAKRPNFISLNTLLTSAFPCIPLGKGGAPSPIPVTRVSYIGRGGWVDLILLQGGSPSMAGWALK